MNPNIRPCPAEDGGEERQLSGFIIMIRLETFRLPHIN